MIIDRLANCEMYYGLSSKIEKAFRYLQENDLSSKEPGTYYIDGNKMFVLLSEYKTKSANEALWEAHRKYIDIQYVIKGVERMGYSNIENIETTVEYDESKDILFGNSLGEFVTVPQGYFTIFMPQDAHMPSINVDKGGKVKKAVIKILIE